jgi:hypothetical protein
VGNEIKHIWDVTVEGEWQFPIDMLRYDSLYPKRGEDSAAIQNMRGFGDVGKIRQIQLTGPCHVTGPTLERWESFGWRVTEATKHRL